jgi:hypothetical protein
MGEFFADVWTPGGVAFAEWARFITSSLWLIPLVLVGIFGLYRAWFYRSARVKVVEDVFRQDRPWVLSLWGVLLLQVVLSVLAGLATVSVKNLESILGMVLLGAAEGGFGMLLYWLVSLIAALVGGLAARVKYIPYLAYRRVRRLPPKEEE